MAAPPEPAVEVRDLAVQYGRRPVLRGVSLRVQPGSAVALVGPSGSGKTTLLKAVAGLVRPSGGEVVLRLPGAAPPATHARAGRIGYIPQHLGLVRNRRVLDNVLLGALARAPRLQSLAGDFPAADVAAAEAALEAVGLAGKAQERVHNLSGGERQRVAIARALLQRPRLLCADEFVSNLDVVNADVVLGLVGALRKEGVTVLMALHDLALARAHADEVVVLRAGAVAASRLAAELSPEEARWLLTG